MLSHTYIKLPAYAWLEGNLLLIFKANVVYRENRIWGISDLVLKVGTIGE